MDVVDLSAISEIIIEPDGRVYVFGMTKPLMEVIETLPTKDHHIRRRQQFVHSLETNTSTLNNVTPEVQLELESNRNRQALESRYEDDRRRAGAEADGKFAGSS